MIKSLNTNIQITLGYSNVRMSYKTFGINIKKKNLELNAIFVVLKKEEWI